MPDNQNKKPGESADTESIQPETPTQPQSPRSFSTQTLSEPSSPKVIEESSSSSPKFRPRKLPWGQKRKLTQAELQHQQEINRQKFQTLNTPDNLLIEDQNSSIATGSGDKQGNNFIVSSSFDTNDQENPPYESAWWSPTELLEKPKDFTTVPSIEKKEIQVVVSTKQPLVEKKAFSSRNPVSVFLGMSITLFLFFLGVKIFTFFLKK